MATIQKARNNKCWLRCGKKKSSSAIDGNVSWCAATMENSMESPQKINTRTIIRSRNSTSGCLLKTFENTNSKRHMHCYVH